MIFVINAFLSLYMKKISRFSNIKALGILWKTCDNKKPDKFIAKSHYIKKPYCQWLEERLKFKFYLNQVAGYLKHTFTLRNFHIADGDSFVSN